MRLALIGELDMATVGTLEEAVDQALTIDHPQQLILDLGELRFCDSRGIGALLEARHAATGRGAAFQAINPRGMTLRTMQVTGLLDLLTALTPAAQVG
ncbi:STAS domain-containing protein [Micromonospora sediminicola]|uniref:STAS domain-containing protein n=1 Tax=Micromonospora sediminicola TaxID=946078 RepID=UPI0037B8FDB9